MLPPEANLINQADIHDDIKTFPHYSQELHKNSWKNHPPIKGKSADLIETWVCMKMVDTMGHPRNGNLDGALAPASSTRESPASCHYCTFGTFCD